MDQAGPSAYSGPTTRKRRASKSALPKAKEDEFETVYKKGDLVFAIREGKWRKAKVIEEDSGIHPETGLEVPCYLIRWPKYGKKYDEHLMIDGLMLRTLENQTIADKDNRGTKKTNPEVEAESAKKTVDVSKKRRTRAASKVGAETSLTNVDPLSALHASLVDGARSSPLESSMETENLGSTTDNGGSSVDPADAVAIAALAISGNDSSEEFPRTMALQERAHFCIDGGRAREDAAGFVRGFNQILIVPREQEVDAVMNDVSGADAVLLEHEAEHPEKQNVDNLLQLPDGATNEEPEKSDEGSENNADLAAVPGHDISLSQSAERVADDYVPERTESKREKRPSSVGHQIPARNDRSTNISCDPNLPVVADTAVDPIAQPSTDATFSKWSLRLRRTSLSRKCTEKFFPLDNLDSAAVVRQESLPRPAAAVASASGIVKEPSASIVSRRNRSLSTSRQTIRTQRSHSFPRASVPFLSCTEPGCRFKGSRTHRGLSVHIGHSHRTRRVCASPAKADSRDNQATSSHRATKRELRGLQVPRGVNFSLPLPGTRRRLQAKPRGIVLRSPQRSILQLKPVIKQVAADRTRVWFCEYVDEIIEFNDIVDVEEPSKLRKKRQKASSKKPQKKPTRGILAKNADVEAGLTAVLKNGNGPEMNKEATGSGTAVAGTVRRRRSICR